MLVVNVREMCVAVLQLGMPVRMGVQLHAIPREIMGVLVVRVMSVRVGVQQFCVLMVVRMMLGQVQPNPCCHQDTSQPENRAGWFAEKCDGDGGADKRRSRKIGPCAGRTQAPQGQNEQHQAHTVSQKANQHGGGHHCRRGQRGTQRKS